VASQKFLVDLDLQGQKIKDFVLGTTVGTENGAIWFDAATGLVKVIDSSGVTQSLSPKSYVDAEVAGEAADRADEITRVEGLITDEASARALAVSGLAADLADEVTARQAAVQNVADDLADETAARQAAVSAEATARQNADAAITTAIQNGFTNGANRMTAIEGVNTTQNSRLDAVEAANSTQDGRLTAAESDIASLQSDLAALDTDFATDAQVAAAVAVETARAEAAEAAIASDLADEVTARGSEISRVETSINEVADFLDAEIQNRQDAVTAVTESLADEVVAREAAVAAVANDLADEVGRATAAEGLIASDLANEVTARQNAVSGVASDLADEATARQNADNALDARIEDLEDATPTYALSATVALDLASEATRADAYADAAALAAENAAKAHADLIAQGLNIKEAVRTVVMQGPGLTQALTGTYTAFSKVTYTIEDEFVFDPTDVGVALAVGDHVIVTDYEGSSAGGIYTVQSGAWTLREDWDNDTTKTGSFVYVTEGWFAGTSWASYEITTGPLAPYQNFTQMTGIPSLYVEDASINLSADGYGISVNVDYLVEMENFARKASGIIAIGSGTSHTISHSLGQDVVVSVRKISTSELVQAQVVCNTGSVVITLNESPADSALKVVIIG
jgi:hypothetical protein